MRIVFAGSPSVALPTLGHLLALSDHQVVGVLTQPPARAGRGRKEKSCAIDLSATAAGLQVLRPTTLRDPQVAKSIADWQPDLGVVVAYGKLIPQQVLDIPTHGWINIHFSALPRWRGAAPVQRAIQHGDNQLAVSIFRLERGLDTGPLYYQQCWPLASDQSAGQALEFLASAALPGLDQSLESIISGVQPQPQAMEGVTLAPVVRTAEAQIPWQEPSSVVKRHVLAFTPLPGAWTWLGEIRCKISPFDTESDIQTLPPLCPGQILATKKAVWVGTGTNPVKLTEIAPAGKKHLPAADWARGASLTKEACFALPTGTESTVPQKDNGMERA